MGWQSLSEIYSLGEAENNLLQVLLSEFEVNRDDDSVELAVRFDRNSPTIRRREAKGLIQNEITDFENVSRALQRKIENVIVYGLKKTYSHKNPEFPFRYASGGALPILNRDGQNYYCLFYRDVAPVGWNIANGACDTFDELLDPRMTIWRELHEELIVVDVSNEIDYLFSRRPDGTVSIPEFNYARRLWQRHIDRDIRHFEKRQPVTNWVDGPDTLAIKVGQEHTKILRGFFLNINATDFGIEVDRVVQIGLDRQAVLLDGEINDNRLLNRPVGLFEVERFHGLLKSAADFLPDRLYYSGRLRPPGQFENLVKKEFLPRLENEGIRATGHSRSYWKTSKPRFGLCPVTSQIVTRYRQLASLSSPKSGVFLSYSRVDADRARKLTGDLRGRGIDVWRDEEEIPAGSEWDTKIQDALDASSHIVLIMTPSSVSSRMVLDEIYYALHKEKRIIPLLFEDSDLPPRLNRLQWIDFRRDYNQGLMKLVEEILVESPGKDSSAAGRKKQLP